MKLLSTVLRRKRGIILFITAFLLPLIFVVVAGIDTFSNRQKTTRNLLESNLWLSGKSALDQIEEEFVEAERNLLNENYFNNLLFDDDLNQEEKNYEIFLIGSDFKVVYPKIGEDRNNLLSGKQNWNSGYRKYMELALNAELNKQDFPAARENYKKSLTYARSAQQEALSIEGLARSGLAGKNYLQAVSYYQLLKNKFSETENLSGHPYGITAPLQLYAISNRIGENIFGKDSLLITLQLIKDGHWLISSSSYFFFKTEYESILNQENVSQNSSYERVLKFNQFLIDIVIPAVKERSDFPEYSQVDETKRTWLQREGQGSMISFKKMLIPQVETYYFAGIRWNMDSIVTHFMLPLLTQLGEESGLEFRLVDHNNTDVLKGEQLAATEENLSLLFRNIPFPWTLVAIQPGYKKLESDAKVQVIIYGLLVVIIILLMLIAVFVLLRDISREADSTLLQTEFVHNVSHELKTPLSLIRLYGETLLFKNHLSAADRKEGLQIITKESERLSYMINNILDFSKIEMGRKEFDLKPGNLAEVVKKTLDSYRYHFVKKGFIIEEEIDQDIPIVLFDKNAVEGILINLFSNAIKFSNNTKTMEVRLINTPEAICLELADKGIGIPPDELSNIFNRFYRVKSTSDFESRGSGLGLTLVKHAVDNHGWQIEVESIPGQGSVFSIKIPLNTNEERQK